MIFKKLSKILILVGIISLVYWPKVFQKGFFIPIRFELIFLLALFANLCYFIGIITLRKKIKLIKKDKEIFLVIFSFVFFIILATIISFFQYGLWFDFKGLSLLFKIVMGVTLFAINYLILKEDPSFLKKLALAFSLPVLIFTPFLLFPNFATKFGLLSGGERFQGLTENPGQWAQLATIAFSYLLVLFLCYAYKKQPKSLLYFLPLLGIGALILWSQSRAYILILPVIALVSIFSLKNYFGKTWTTSVSYLILGILLLSLFFLFLPSTIKPWLLYRTRQTIQTENNPRIVALKYYGKLIIENPLGLGINFEQKFLADFINPRGEMQKLGPHSLLDLWVYGGIFACFSIFYLLWLGFLNLKRKLRQKKSLLTIYSLGTIMALLALWIAGIFSGSPVAYLHFWILLAMALS